MDFVDYLPLFQESNATIRARLDDDANAGLDPSDDLYLDTREGSFFHDITQVFVLEMSRLWDALATEVPAAATPLYAWGEYLDDWAEVFGLARKPPVRAGGEVLFTGTPGTAVASNTEVGALTTSDPSYDPPAFVTTQSGVIGAALAVPAAPTLTGSAAGGNLAAATYYYAVSALNAYGETEESVEATVTTTGTTSRVTLDWPDVAGATHYRVYRRTSGALQLLAEPSASNYVDLGNTAPTATAPPVADTTGGKLRLAIEAVDDGPMFNVSAGAIVALNTPVPGVTSVVNEEPTVGGADAESDPSLRERVLNAFQGSGAGTEADYKRWALSRPGVGQVHVIPNWNGAGTVLVVIMDADGQPVSASVVTDVQNYLDPIVGEGKGQAPIGASVTVQTPAIVLIDVSATLTLESGYSLDGSGGTIAVRQPVEDALREYIDGLAVGEDVVFNHVEAMFFDVEGVYDVSGVVVEGVTSGVVAISGSAPAQVAQLGTVALS